MYKRQIACDFVLVLVWLSSSFVLRLTSFWGAVAKKRYQAVGFPYNRMLKLGSIRGITIDVPVLSISWSFVDHSVNIQALKNGHIEHEASDTGGVPRWKSSCPDRLAEATVPIRADHLADLNRGVQTNVFFVESRMNPPKNSFYFIIRAKRVSN